MEPKTRPQPTLYSLIFSAALAIPVSGCKIFDFRPEAEILKEGLETASKNVVGTIRLYEDLLKAQSELVAAKAKGKVRYAVPPCNSSISLLALGSTSNLEIKAELVHPDGTRDDILTGLFPNTIDEKLTNEAQAQQLLASKFSSVNFPKEGVYTIEWIVDPKNGHGAYVVALVIEDPNTKEKYLKSPVRRISDRNENKYKFEQKVGPPIADSSSPQPGKTTDEKWEILFKGLEETYSGIDASTVQLEIERSGTSQEGRTRQEHLIQTSKNKLKCYNEEISNFLKINPNPAYEVEYAIFKRCQPNFEAWTK